jgi:hypothetical protein
VSYGFPAINFCNPGVHYEMPCINKEKNGSSHSSPYLISQDSYSKTLFKYTLFLFNMVDVIYSINTAAIRCTFSKKFI